MRPQRPHGAGLGADRSRLTEVTARRCRVCRRTLTTPASRAAGIGPVCAARDGENGPQRCSQGRALVLPLWFVVVEADGQLALPLPW